MKIHTQRSHSDIVADSAAESLRRHLEIIADAKLAIAAADAVLAKHGREAGGRK